MPVDRALLALSEAIEADTSWPRPACPACETGYIHFTAPSEYESYESASSRGHHAFEPEWIHGTFVIRGKCENVACQQLILGTGNYKVDFSRAPESDPFESNGPDYVSFYTLTHLHPPMSLMPVPESAPVDVREGVFRASRVLLADPALAATAMRATVERLLTSEGISAKDANGNFRTAHVRIDEWQTANPSRTSVAELLFALKWIGNAGTHEDADLTVKEVLESAEVLDEVIHRLFTGPNIDAHAQTINAAKGPAR